MKVITAFGKIFKIILYLVCGVRVGSPRCGNGLVLRDWLREIVVPRIKGITLARCFGSRSQIALLYLLRVNGGSTIRIKVNGINGTTANRYSIELLSGSVGDKQIESIIPL